VIGTATGAAKNNHRRVWPSARGQPPPTAQAMIAIIQRFERDAVSGEFSQRRGLHRCAI
jgi:hypothetical protein